MKIPAINYPQTGTIDLANMIEMYTESVMCGAYQVYSFHASTETTLTTAADDLHLSPNPSVRNLATDTLSMKVNYNFTNAEFPLILYLRAETNGLGSTNQNLSFNLKLIQCDSQPLVLDSAP